MPLVRGSCCLRSRKLNPRGKNPPASAGGEVKAGVRSQGYAEGYRGLRESGTGRRFWIEDVTIWNLAGADGAVRGQAALIHSWSDA
ncbi:MEKHLA domain-containing protein [Streptomyces mirabilis]|uniref:MEKHLA domain-containing protein n=1 Tax=Streptomyces mirabilis TaxID=68239 RepID=UPI00099E1AA4|nr:MEKHLA domain-containing protein [Streptomyces mirabilis]MCX4428975.1 MEKHLA domain-containing protein [Streptomyces mirabilis]